MTTVSDVTLVFNNTPFAVIGGVALGTLLLLTAAARVREWREERGEESGRTRGGESDGLTIAPPPRREALELIAKLGAVRGRMLELDRALAQRREGARWRFGLGDGADSSFRDADSDVDRFLSGATERDLNAAQGEMISLFRDAANWLKKYAPEEVPPPSLRERVRTFLGGFFPALKPDTDTKMIPVVRKAEEKHWSDNVEPSEKVANAELPDATPKSREKLRLPLDLLEAGKSENLPDAASLRQKAKRLSEVLRTYKIDAVPSGTPVRGPSVTRYEFRLQQGVKLKKLVNLADDIALSLGVGGVRIAPVPGKSGVVGIEVPNPTLSPVRLRDVLESREFLHGSSATFALGRGIGGGIVTGDIAELPHVLIAGTTGSGKSVCLNALIVSLLYKSAPEELRFLMIDPKKVELTAYNGIPHLAQPVVIDPAQAVSALEQVAKGMETRYQTFSEHGVKELSDYNRKSKTPMPRMVIVIDELADLMMNSGKEIEESIIHIAQMGRAAGIHLVIATQRPTKDVVTGLIKANIPSRIAFAVTSELESRIILDSAGAEKLCGNGDMLYAPQNANRKRVQGCYISTEEVENVTSFVKKFG